MRVKLTKRAVDDMIRDHQHGQELFIWDTELRGFGLRITKNGVVTFIIQYRNQQGETRRMVLGQYGKTTPDQARKDAIERFGQVNKGEDPSVQKREERQATRFQELADRYLAEHATVKKKASSVEADTRLLEKTLMPILGSQKIKSIEPVDIQKLHHSLRETPIKANRAIALLSKMFNLAEKWGLRPNGSNPCRHIEKYQEKHCERFLNEDELANLGAALEAAEGRESPYALAAIRLILFTGCRKNEILTLQWSNVDVERGVFRLGDSKTGAKVVPLSDVVIEIIGHIPSVAGNPYVIAGTESGKHFVGLHRVWDRVRKEAGLEGVRIHDLRHGFGSMGAWLGLGLPIIGALLGHSQPQTTARYVHMATNPLKQAADKVCNRIDEAMKATPQKNRGGQVDIESIE